MKTLKNYIKFKGYRNNSSILGAIFYGSRATECYTDNSDYDLLIITSENNINTKVIEYFDSKRFECHKISFNLINDTNFLKKDYILLSIIAHGIILFDNQFLIKDIQIHANTILSNKSYLQKLSDDETISLLISIENSMREIQRCFDNKSLAVNHLCNLTAEKIRKFYHRYKELPPIRDIKVFRVYTDKNYHTKNFFSIPLPEQKFIDLYLKVVTSTDEIKNNLETLWKYCKDKVVVNSNVNNCRDEISYTSTNCFYEEDDDDDSY